MRIKKSQKWNVFKTVHPVDPVHRFTSHDQTVNKHSKNNRDSASQLNIFIVRHGNVNMAILLKVMSRLRLIPKLYSCHLRLPLVSVF